MKKGKWLCCACLLALFSTLTGCWGDASGAVEWERLPAPLDRAEVHGLEYAKTEGALYVATNGEGVWRHDGSSSELLSGPLDSALVFSLAVVDDGSVLYAAAGDRGVWSFAGGEWSDTGMPGSAYVLQLDEASGALYAGTNHAVWRYAGETWGRLEGLPDAKVFSFAMGTPGVLYAGTDDGPWVCEEGTWRRVGAALSGQEVLSLALDQASGLLFAGTRTGGVWEFREGAWRIFEKGPLENPAWSMEYDGDLGLLLVGTSYGAWSYYEDFWVWTEGRVKEYAILAIAVDADAISAYVGTFEDVGVWKGDLDGILDSR